jgi:NAD(P)-dependent dehydrogenase (short-subunit alcohol dehydrogenase family)
VTELQAGLLAGKIVLVSGASRGIGAAAAQLFAAEGATVVLTARGEPELAKLVDGITADGNEASYVVSDVADPQSAADVVAAVLERHGRLDGAFNNVGLGQSGIPLAESTDADFDLVTTINMRSVYAFMKAEIAAMLANPHGCSIVNNSSLAGFLGNPGGAGYAATKHAVVGLTRSAAGEYGAYGIRINAIAPGTTGTEMVREWEQLHPGVADTFVARASLRRMADPSEIAEVALWLLCDRSSYVTGVLLPVDGGLSAVV